MKEVFKTFDESFRGKPPKDPNQPRTSITEWQCSNLGNVRKILHPSGEIVPVQLYEGGGHPGTRYWVLPKNKYKYVHRIVGELFVPNPEDLPIIDHIDGDKKNNNSDNLRWCTYKQNSYFAKELRAK